MKGILKIKILAGLLAFAVLTLNAEAQVLEWRLTNAAYNAIDPDGAGPATGSTSFTLQIHTTSGSVNNVSTISLGWSYQSAKAMIPATPGCAVVSNPANVVVSPAFAAGGFTYTTVNQCGNFNQSVANQNFDKRAVGTLDGTSINITTTWMDVFTVTLWTLGVSNPEGGYVILNSGAGGTPGAFPTYAVADLAVNEYVVNSVTYNTPLEVGSRALPVNLTDFSVVCTGKGALVQWKTASEENSHRFEIETSLNGVDGWNKIAEVNAAGNSAAVKQYKFTDAIKRGVIFYRLRQVDKDGKFTYSYVVKLNCEGNTPGLSVYPVPATDVLNVVLQAENNGKATIKILDVTGKAFKTLQTTVLRGPNKITFDVKGLIAGQYILRVEKGDEVETIKVLIQ